MDARYLYAIAIGIIAGVLLDIAYVVTAVIDVINDFYRAPKKESSSS
jgi:hypothetical protein